MSKKQKKVLVRMIVALVLLAGVILLDKLALLPQWAMIVLYLVPYFVIGYDILWKALKGIKNRQAFDEFLNGGGHRWRPLLTRLQRGRGRYVVLPDRRAVSECGGGQEP